MGCSDGGLRLIPLGSSGGDGVPRFESGPRLWRAVCGGGPAHSPGIVSVHVGSMGSGIGGGAASPRQLIFAMGTEDGSVAVFALKVV